MQHCTDDEKQKLWAGKYGWGNKNWVWHQNAESTKLTSIGIHMVHFTSYSISPCFWSRRANQKYIDLARMGSWHFVDHRNLSQFHYCWWRKDYFQRNCQKLSSALVLDRFCSHIPLYDPLVAQWNSVAAENATTSTFAWHILPDKTLVTIFNERQDSKRDW